MKKLYLFISLSIPIGANEDYFDNLSDELALNIISYALQEKDFNKVLQNFSNLPIVNKKLERLTKDKSLKKEIISLSLQGDLNSVIKNLDTLYAHPKFKKLASNKKFTQWLVENVLPSKLVKTITSLSSSELQNQKDLEVLSALILGTPLAFSYVNNNDLKSFIPHLVKNLSHISPVDWKENSYVYKKLAQSLRAFVSINNNPHIYYFLLQYAIMYFDIDMVKLLLTDTNNFDITNFIRIAFARLDCNKSFEIIKILLEYSHNFQTETINYLKQHQEQQKMIDPRCNETISLLEEALEEKKNPSKKIKLS